MPLIPASQETQAGESLEPRKQRLQWAKITPLHSSLGHRMKLRLKKKKKKKKKKKEKKTTGFLHHCLASLSLCAQSLDINIPILQIRFLGSEREEICRLNKYLN